MSIIRAIGGLANSTTARNVMTMAAAALEGFLISTGGGNGSEGGDDIEDRNDGGGGNGGSGDGGDGGDFDFNKLWKILESQSPCIAKYKGRKIIQSKCKQYWYSKDTAGHGGAVIKRFEDTRSSLKFKDSLDENMQPMTGKHESNQGLVIMKNELDIVKRK